MLRIKEGLSLDYHQRLRGMISVESKVPVKDQYVLSLLYTPGVGAPCVKIKENTELSFEYTSRGNLIAIVTDGSAVLGLGNMGPLAALPIMEGKSVLYKNFAGIDAIPICLSTQDPEEIIETVRGFAPTFGAINLEDIASPHCFVIEECLEKALSIPVFHSDQHAAAIVILAALTNAIEVVGKGKETVRIVINGAGAAGIATAKLLLSAGFRQIVLCDSQGTIFAGRSRGMNWAKEEIAKHTNQEKLKGSLEDAARGADILIGLSAPGLFSQDMIRTLGKGAIVFALATPEPEIEPQEALDAGAEVVATARPDHPNQVNAVLAFPGILRGALDVRAYNITEEMKIAAAMAIAGLVEESDLNPRKIIPKVMDFRVPCMVAAAVAEEAIRTGNARLRVTPQAIMEKVQKIIYEGEGALLPDLFSQAFLTSPEKALEYHRKHRGSIGIRSKLFLRDEYSFAIISTPGVAEVSRAVVKDPGSVFDLTNKGNTVAIVTDGSAVLGLGNIGAEAAMPVMEGKSVLFKSFGGVDAFPVCLDTQDPNKIVELVKRMEPGIGGVNLEDISAPRCFEIEERLKKETNIPIFHDDQHGTAVVVLAALINALRLVGKKISEIFLVINGAGAAGVAVTKLLLHQGVMDVILCDTKGAIYDGRVEGMNWAKEEIARITNPRKLKGTLADVLRGADVFIGLSGPGLVSKEMVSSMRGDAIVFAMANPVPEIMPDLAKEAGAAIVATGRSDFDNQVNNALAFPGIFRGALDVRARNINEQMKLAAANALAGLISEPELSPGYIISKVMDLRVAPAIAAAVAGAALETGEAQALVSPEDVAASVRDYIYEGRLRYPGRRIVEAS